MQISLFVSSVNPGSAESLKMHLSKIHGFVVFMQNRCPNENIQGVPEKTLVRKKLITSLTGVFWDKCTSLLILCYMVIGIGDMSVF